MTQIVDTFYVNTTQAFTPVDPLAPRTWCFNSLQMSGLFTSRIYFQSLEVVCRGSETQLQVTEKFNYVAHNIPSRIFYVNKPQTTTPVDPPVPWDLEG